MGKREKTIFILLACLGVASLLISSYNFYVAHTNPAPSVGGEYREGILGQPRLINSVLATTPVDTALTRLVLSSLYKYDGSGNLIPDLAEGMPKISEDKKEYTVALKKKVTWHNGRPFSADDVIFTIKTVQDPEFKSPARNEWTRTTIEKIDDYTVTFKNTDISAPFINNLTIPIISKTIWNKVSADTFILSSNNLEAVGTGPYVIKEIRKLPTGKIQSLKLESYSNYYLGKPYVNTLVLSFYENYGDIINALHAGEINGFGYVPLDKNLYLDRNNPDLRILELPLPQYQAVFFNTKDSILLDKNVRKALQMASDKAYIVKEVFGGEAKLVNGPVLPEQFGFNNMLAPTAYDRTVAEKMLDDAGWKINEATGLRTKNKIVLEITLATNDSQVNTKSAEILAEQWRALRITVNLNVLPSRELTENLIRPRKFGALLFAQNTGSDPDQFAFWHSSQTKNPGLNITGFSNPEADKLISAARITINPKMRAEKYQRFQEIIYEEVPAIFLDQTIFVYAIDSRIKNVTLKNLFDPAYRFSDIPNWYIQERRVWK